MTFRVNLSWLSLGYRAAVSARLLRELSNVPGWSSRRKLVVIASDDWGTIRMPSEKARQRLRMAGVCVDDSRFNRFDSLESNDDLELLFELLSKHRDKNNRPAVMTALCNVANPDFERIRADGFRRYYWEPVSQTLGRYPGRDHVETLYHQGMTAGVFAPEYHGREHLHVRRWMRGLRAQDPVLCALFDEQALGPGPYGVGAAYDRDSVEECGEQHQIVREGLSLFARQFGRSPRFFTAPSLLHSEDLEMVLSPDVQFIDVGRRHRYVNGDGTYRVAFRRMGQVNRKGQVYLTRNCIFEQNLPGVTDPVGRCLADVAAAFRWGKPAIISTHRVSVAGGIDPTNRSAGLRLLDALLTTLLMRWPEVEFMSVSELGNLIAAA